VNAPYRRQLVSVLSLKPEAERDIQKWNPRRQLEELIIRPVASIPEEQWVEGRKVILAIDSLEECLLDDPTSSADLAGLWLREVMEVVGEESFQNSRIKFLIISHEHRLIKSLLDHADSASSYSMTEYKKSDSALTEMMQFYKCELGQLASYNLSSGNSNWPSEEEVTELSNITRGSFFQARIICSQIRESLNPEEKLKDGITKGDFKKGIQSYYQSLLDETTKGFSPEESEIFWKALRTIALLRRLVSIEDLALIMNYDYPEKLRVALTRKVPFLVYTPMKNSQLQVGKPDVIRVQDTVFADYVGKGEVSHSPVDLSTLECNLAADLLRLLNKTLPEIEEGKRFDENHPDYRSVYELRGLSVERRIKRAIGYAAKSWWTHLQKSLEAPSPTSPKKLQTLRNSQVAIIRELAQLLEKKKRRAWIAILENEVSQDVRFPAKAISAAKSFLEVSFQFIA